MTERLAREVELLRKVHSQVDMSADTVHVTVREMTFPAGWNRSSTDILIVVPPGYPVTPPDNFFVPAGLRLAGGQVPGNYSESTRLLGKDWGQFSFHSQEWRPSPNEADGDNLTTFIALVERRLSEVN